MDMHEPGQYEARLSKRRADLELRFDLGDARREAIMKCLDGGELRMVLQEVDLDRLSLGDLRGGYLWD